MEGGKFFLITLVMEENLYPKLPHTLSSLCDFSNVLGLNKRQIILCVGLVVWIRLVPRKYESPSIQFLKNRLD